MTTPYDDLESNASQLTLVSPEPTTTLVFSKPSALNTVLLVHGNPLFRISTLDAAADRTTISDVLTGEALVVIQRRDLLPSVVEFTDRNGSGKRKLKLKEWLKEEDSETENGMKVPEMRWGIETDMGRFVWRTDEVLRLALCPSSNLSHPIAWAQPSQAQTDSSQAASPFALVLTRGTEPFREEIVASFIVLEQRLRMSEKAAYLKEKRIRARISSRLV